ncbi:hypothetical protein Tco_1415100 [Tanacetum coccineum]
MISLLGPVPFGSTVEIADPLAEFSPVSRVSPLTSLLGSVTDGLSSSRCNVQVVWDTSSLTSAIALSTFINSPINGASSFLISLSVGIVCSIVSYKKRST